MKDKKITRKEFVLKTSKVAGGLALCPMVITMLQSCSKDPVFSSNDSFGKKIRTAVKSKVPNLLIIGEKERVGQKVTWQRFGSKKGKILSFDSFLKLIKEEINQRKDWRL